MPRFKETTEYSTVDTRSGAAQGLMSLAERLNVFKSIGNQLVKVGAEGMQQEAVKRGLTSASKVTLEKEDGLTKPPKMKEKTFFGSVEAATHNKALRAAYLASIGNDIRLNVSRIESENSDNLVKFNESINGWMKGIINSSDPTVRQDLLMKINERVTTSRINVQNNTIEKQNKEASNVLKVSGENILDEALRFSSNGDLRSAANGLLDYNNVLNSRVDAGFLSESEAIQMKRKAELRATHENLVGNIRRIANGGKVIDAINLIDNAQQKIPKGMSVDEHQDLTAAMIAELNQGINNRENNDRISDKNLKKSQSLNYSSLAIGITSGQTNQQEITRNLRDGKITEQQFDKLINTLNNRGFGVDSYPLINSIHDDIRNGRDEENIRDTIISNSGRNLTEETATGLLRTLEEYTDKESLLHTNTVRRARDFITPSIRISGPLGALDMEAESRLAMAIRNFDERVLAGEDPWTIADELVGREKLDRAPVPKYGTKDNLDDAMRQLNEAFDKKQIDENTYNYEYRKIEDIKSLSENIKAFEKAKKEAYEQNR